MEVTPSTHLRWLSSQGFNYVNSINRTQNTPDIEVSDKSRIKLTNITCWSSVFSPQLHYYIPDVSPAITWTIVSATWRPPREYTAASQWTCSSRDSCLTTSSPSTSRPSWPSACPGCPSGWTTSRPRPGWPSPSRPCWPCPPPPPASTAPSPPWLTPKPSTCGTTFACRSCSSPCWSTLSSIMLPGRLNILYFGSFGVGHILKLENVQLMGQF